MMLKKLSLLMILLLTVCLTGCGNTIMPEKAVQDFEDSINFDEGTGILSFTIPNGLSSKYSFYIHISGRVKIGDGAMSIHLFEDESENNSWESGKTYSYEFGNDELIEASIVAGIQEQGKSEVLYETQIDIKAELDEIITDSISYPIENADPSIGAFGNDLLHTYNDELVILLNQWLNAHRNGTFNETPNHHPPYPSDFPSASQLPVINRTKALSRW